MAVTVEYIRCVFGSTDEGVFNQAKLIPMLNRQAVNKCWEDTKYEKIRSKDISQTTNNYLSSGTTILE